MNDNVVKFKGGKDKDELPSNDYAIVDINDIEYTATGFMVFTPQHIAVMREVDGNSIPVFVMPLHLVKFTELIADEEVEELPF